MGEKLIFRMLLGPANTKTSWQQISGETKKISPMLIKECCLAVIGHCQNASIIWPTVTSTLTAILSTKEESFFFFWNVQCYQCDSFLTNLSSTSAAPGGIWLPLRGIYLHIFFLPAPMFRFSILFLFEIRADTALTISLLSISIFPNKIIASSPWSYFLKWIFLHSPLPTQKGFWMQIHYHIHMKLSYTKTFICIAYCSSFLSSISQSLCEFSFWPPLCKSNSVPCAFGV